MQVMLRRPYSSAQQKVNNLQAQVAETAEAAAGE